MPKGTAGRTPATCHPDKPMHAKGLCSTCYRRTVRVPKPRRERPFSDCHPDRRQHSHGLCYSCYQRDWKVGRRAESAEARGRFNKRAQNKRYKMTEEQFDALVIEQGGCCAACETPCPNLQVDHDHKTGAVRALLCGGCNCSAGMAGDDATRLRAIADYLDRYPSAGASSSVSSSSAGAAAAGAAAAAG